MKSQERGSAPSALSDKSTTMAQPAEQVATSPELGRRPSLKRKRAQEDQDDASAGYPHNLLLLYPPKKRSRTPTAEDDTGKTHDSAPTRQSSPVDNFAVTTEAPTTEALILEPPSTPKLTPRATNDVPKTPPAFGSSAIMTSTLSKTTPVSRTITSSAFAAFAGTASPFASATFCSPLAKEKKPVWTLPTNDLLATSKRLHDAAEAAATNESSDEESGVAQKKSQASHALEAAFAAGSTVEYLTGEENEDVELELKGVKLFVKRGKKPFSDGMTGHIKLLSNKETLDERLLFRREPLWQVSMNVRVQPSMRCALDKDEKVLRIITQELIDATVPPEDQKWEIVVYALKPSRACSKQDFCDFADSLIDSPGLKSK